jgi:putative transposase
VEERKKMIDRANPMPITQQCRILERSRSSVYYQPLPLAEAELALMRRIDEIHLKLPFYGSRRIRDQLQREGLKVNRKKVQRLMHLMGISALYPKRRTSLPGDGHRIYPYLLRDLSIERPNQVWCTDICYIPMARGFLYLVAVMDWYSRKVLAWRLSNTLDTEFCVDALEEALRRHGTPEIFNTDQGTQFTSDLFTRVLKDVGVRISMDSKGRWIDNVFIERLWRTLKYEEVYLKAYESVAEAIRGIGDYFDLYNEERPHQALARLTPNEVYAGGFTLPEAA